MNPGERIGERFIVKRFVARGGMGDVYLAIDGETGQQVALKILKTDDPGFAKRLSLEARALLELNHPAIVRYVAHGEDSSLGQYLAMEWLQGVTLSDRLKTRPLDIEESLQLAVRVADGLGAAHARGMVHRDIKPLNLLLVDNQHDGVKVLDFGIVRLNEWQQITATGVGMGTPEYMAPEQARGLKEIGAQADVFALGCVLFKCLTGETAFRGKQIEAILAKIALVNRPPRVTGLRPEIPEAVDELVSEMMAYEPQQRPRDGSVCAERIRDALRSLQSVAEAGERIADELAPQPSLTGRELQPVAVIFAELAVAEARTLPSQVISVEVVNAARPGSAGGAHADADANSHAQNTSRSLEAVRVQRGSSDAVRVLPAVRRALEPYGARVESLLNGSIVAMLSGGVAATDLATRSARCALAIRSVIPEVSIGVSTQRGIIDDRRAIGPIIDAAAALVRSGEQQIRIDRSTRDLLPPRFAVVDASGGAAFVLEHERSRERLPDEPPRELLGKATQCVGRNGLLRQLSAAFAGVVEDRAAESFVVVGDAGVGKSRVRAELVRKLQRAHSAPVVITAWGDQVRDKAPFGLLARCIRQYLEIPEGDEAVRRNELRARIARHVPEEDRDGVTEFLGELIGVSFADADSPPLRAARSDAQLMAEQKQRAFEAWFAAEAGAHPVLFVIDDLHWADQPSVELIAHGLKRVADLPVMVLALARPEVDERFPRLGDQWGRQEIPLDNLRPAACEQLVRDALGDNVDSAACALLVERSDGNPFYLEELIRATAAGEAAALPDSIVASVQMRLGRLPNAARQVLRAASIFGRSFWAAGIHRLLGSDTPESEVDEWLVALDKEEIVQRQHGGAFAAHIQYAFRHDLIREAAYQTLTDEDRTTGHRLAGSWLQAVGETDPVVLAEHFAGGGAADQAVSLFERAAEQVLDEQAMEELEDEATDSPNVTEALTKAATYYRRAAQTAMRSYANESAIGFFERSVALWAFLDRAEAAKTRLELAEVRERVGLRRLALEDLERAEEDASADMASPELLVRVLLQRSGLQRREESDGALERAGAVAERARELAESAGERSLEGEALTLLARILTQYQTEESSARAVRYAEMALELSRDHGDLGVRLWRLGNAFAASHDLDRATHLYDEALVLAERAGDDSLIASCLGNMAMVAFRSWRLDEAIESTRKALEIHRRIGYRIRILESTLNLGTFYQVRGDTAAARPLLLEALADARGDWIITTLCQESLADLERNEGREDSAQRYLRAGARLCEKVGVPQKQAVYLGLLAESYWAVGKARLALESLDSAVEVGEGLTLSHAFILLHLGQYDEAQEWLERFQEHEPDPDRRASARLALARLHWWTGDRATAQRICADALDFLQGTKIKRFFLPAEALAACIDENIADALDALEKSKRYCAPHVFPEVALDVGTLLSQIEDESDSARDRYLWITAKLAGGSLAYRIEDLRGKLYRRADDTQKARECLAKAREQVETMLSEMRESHRQLFEEHEWVSELQRYRLVP